MSFSFSVQPFDAEIEAAYTRLLPEQAEINELGKLIWKFRQGPHGPGYAAVARDGESGPIIGLIGLIATRLRTGGKTLPGLQAIDTVVDPSFRGRGLFVGMGNAIYRQPSPHGAAALWGFPNANAGPGWFGKLRWTNFGQVPFLIKPLRTGYFARRLRPALAWLDLPLGLRRPAADPTRRPIERFDERSTALWRAFASELGVAVDRDADWLNWRLIDGPIPDYVSTGSFDGDRLRAMVASCVRDKHDGRIAYVMEAIAAPGENDALVRLLRGEIARAADEGAEVALAWCPPGAPNRRAYARAGFWPLPARLRPIQIFHGCRMLADDLPAELAQAASWYVSYLDSDTV